MTDIIKCSDCKIMLHTTCATDKKITKLTMKTWKCNPCSAGKDVKNSHSPRYTVSATGQCSSDSNISIKSTPSSSQSPNVFMSEISFKKDLASFKSLITAHIAGIIEDKFLTHGNKSDEIAAQNNAIL